MSQIIIDKMSFSYKSYFTPIFNNVSNTLDTDWKLALIGRNGRGKTTLLKLIHGTLVPDNGNIYKKVTTEFFPYEYNTKYTKTIDVLKENINHLRSMEDNLEDIQVLQQYLEAEGFEMESKIKKEFHKMMLSENILEQDFELLSGGEKTKILLIALFLRKNTFILLDEPTNHLDIDGKDRIANYLSRKKGFIVVSHDRDFLDQVCDHVISINKADINIEKGNYTTWKQNKDLKEEYEFRSKKRLEHEIISLEKRAGTARNWANIAEKEKNPFANHSRGNTSRAAKFMHQAKRSENKVISNLEVKKSLLLNYETAKELILDSGNLYTNLLLQIKNLSYSYNNLPLLQDISLKINTGEAIWIQGKNGSGKSTILKLINKTLYSDAIQYAEDLVISTAYQEPLWKHGFLKNILENIHESFDAERFYSLCTIFDMPENYKKKPLETYSSGELKKLDIARALSCNHQLLLLDEPLNYMDVYFREQLEKALQLYKPTLIFVEHDKRFGMNIASRKIEL